MDKIKRLPTLILACALLAIKMQAQDATTILNKAAAAYDKAAGWSVEFTLYVYTGNQKEAQGIDGVLRMKGERFTLEMADIKVWYNGSTQWVYRNQEVNVSVPLEEELQSTHPMLLLKGYKKNYTAVFGGEGTDWNGKPLYKIKLTPLKKGEVEQVELMIGKQSGLPVGMLLTSGNMRSEIRIMRLTAGEELPDASFTFDEAAYPAVEIIDLR